MGLMEAGVTFPVPCGPVFSFSVLQTQHRSEEGSSEQGTTTQESKLMSSLSKVLFLTPKKEIYSSVSQGGSRTFPEVVAVSERTVSEWSIKNRHMYLWKFPLLMFPSQG